MTRYAERTEVTSGRSRDEIERTLQRYGATAFAYGWDAGAATIMFEVQAGHGLRRVRFRLQLPDRHGVEFVETPTGRQRSATAAEQEYERAVRQRWRALALVIKAKLEAVAAGISTVEDEFLAHICLPDGSTVGEWARPQLVAAYGRGAMPALMPGGSA